MAMRVIEHIEVDEIAGRTTIEFASIPDIYTDLRLVMSLRVSTATPYTQYKIRFNDSTTNYSELVLYGIPTTVDSGATAQQQFQYNHSVADSATSSTFSNSELYILNYASSSPKSASFDGVTEDSSTSGVVMAIASKLWNDSAPISSIQLITFQDSFMQYSSATLYGITAGSDGTTTVS